MIIDEYLNQPVSLDWTTDNFDLATRIIRKLEERKVVYSCSRNTTSGLLRFLPTMRTLLW